MTIRSLVGASSGIEESRFSIVSANPSVLDGDFESIATVTVGSGGAADVEFTSIPGTYQHLQIRGIYRSNRAVATHELYVLANGGGGSIYSSHALTGNGSSASASGTFSASEIGLAVIPGASATSSVFGSMVLTFLDYTSTTKNKTYWSLHGVDTNGAGQVGIRSGLRQSSDAITSIKIYPSSNSFVQHSTFALYGIKAP